jgi:pilus assembly protein TadC
VLPASVPWALVAAGSAGLAVFLLLDPPAGLRGLTGGPRGRGGGGEVSSWLRGRPDALSLRLRLLVGLLAIAGIEAALLRLGGPSPGWAVVPVPLVLAAVVGLGWLEPAATRRRRHRLVLQTPQALELLAACLAAGSPVRSACRAVVDAFDGPVAEDLGRVNALTALGVGDAEAWRALASHPQLGAAAADLARSVESGTLLVEGLRQHAVSARRQRRAALEVAARGVGVRSVLPLMCCFIPAFVLLGVVPSVASALARALSF